MAKKAAEEFIGLVALQICQGKGHSVGLTATDQASVGDHPRALSLG